MENQINFYYSGNEDQATAAALKLMPKTGKNREIKVQRYSDGYGHRSPIYQVTVRFINHHVYAVVTEAADIFEQKEDNDVN